MYLISGLVNNKGADQPAHPHSLISAIAFRSFESIVSRLSVIKETCLNLALSKTLKTGLFSGLENSTRPLVFTSASDCGASENFDISSEN